jgi:hypothetical protein
VGATGFEPPANSTGKTPQRQNSAANSGAVSPENAPARNIDRVQALAAELATLTLEDRARLAALLLGEQVDGRDN